MINVTNPESPQIVGSVDTPGMANGVAISGDFAYIADGSAGLQIAWRQCEEPSAVEMETPVLEAHFLEAYPNPFNPNITVSFSLDRSQGVRISIFDMAGRCVAEITDQVYGTGSHTVKWNGKDSFGRAVSSGPYLVRMETESSMYAKKVMLLR